MRDENLITVEQSKRVQIKDVKRYTKSDADSLYAILESNNPFGEEDEIEITDNLDDIISIEDMETEDETSETNEDINLISNENSEEGISDITEININDENTEN